ncbi:hypothetical protein SLEP1_g60186 [Rubroshorea leprosula]|uniref:Uncharacterized protein n=1 Tax=Rubroshorea leprosula TaxID=152421 RepID=A0AAV5MXJ8_9ROSI|nr:hypothetical protein SLEP1_g60186 [Rubroshorea leprosula]
MNMVSEPFMIFEGLQKIYHAKDAGLMMFYVAGMGGVLCYNISPKRQGWLVNMQIGTKRVLNIASSHFHD